MTLDQIEQEAARAGYRLVPDQTEAEVLANRIAQALSWVHLADGEHERGAPMTDQARLNLDTLLHIAHRMQARERAGKKGEAA